MNTDLIKKNILITGGTGLLGTLWSNAMKDKYKITLTYKRKKNIKTKFPSIKLDLNNHNNIINYIQDNNIDILVNLVGLANVESCENDKDLAYHLNEKIPEEIAIACEKTNCKMIHISTDLIYGDNIKLHKEDDEPLLLNNYAKSKYAGEKKVLNEYPKALVCRTNFFGYGPSHRQSMSDWIINECKNNHVLTLFDDVYFNPLIGSNLANYAHGLLEMNAFGLYNLSSDNQVTKYEFAKYLCILFDIPLTFIKPGKLIDRLDLIRRPLAMGLDNKKASNKLRLKLGTVQENINLLKKQG